MPSMHPSLPVHHGYRSDSLSSVMRRYLTGESENRRRALQRTSRSGESEVRRKALQRTARTGGERCSGKRGKGANESPSKGPEGAVKRRIEFESGHRGTLSFPVEFSDFENVCAVSVPGVRYAESGQDPVGSRFSDRLTPPDSCPVAR